MMEDWTKKSDQELFGGVSEQPGSVASYGRDLEIRRRLFALDSATARAQIDAAEAQKRAAEASVKMAWWTMVSALAVAATVILTAAGLWIGYN